MSKFLGFFELEEFLTDGELVVDFFLGETKVGNVEESYRVYISNLECITRK